MSSDSRDSDNANSASFFTEGTVDLSGIGKGHQVIKREAQAPLGQSYFASQTQGNASTVETPAPNTPVEPTTNSQYLEGLADFLGEPKRTKANWKRTGILGAAIVFVFLFTYGCFAIFYLAAENHFEMAKQEATAQFKLDTGLMLYPKSSLEKFYIPNRVMHRGKVVRNDIQRETSYQGTLQVYELDVKEGETYSVIVRDVTKNPKQKDVAYLEVYLLDDQQSSLASSFGYPEELTNEQKSTSVGELTARDNKLSYVAKKTETITIEIVTIDEQNKHDYILIVE